MKFIFYFRLRVAKFANTLFTRNVFVSTAFDLKFVIAYSKLGKCSSYCWIFY